jgi:CubicO group peptidase (beta-lactamase class C family)
MLAALLLALAPLPQADRAGEAARIDERVQAAMRAPGAVGISVAVARGDELLYARAYGFADLEFAVPADEETLFRIGSVTKTFTAAAVLKLAERGKLALDEPLTRYLPDYPTHGHEITLRHLLTHTSGIPNYTDLGERWEPLQARELADEELLALWTDLELDFPPGTRWSYSNSGYYLLGMVVARVSGKSYPEFLRDVFLDPLKLARTRYDSNREVLLNRAQGYAYADGRFLNDLPLGMSQPGAAGGLVSTASDLVRWQQALVAGRAVEPASFEEMTLPFLLADGRETSYGLGLARREIAGHACLGHDGGIHGFNSTLIYCPEAALHVAVLSNSEALRAEALGTEIVKLLLASPKGG